MGRGRAKAKQTKVARDLKYRSHETDFGALAKELHGSDGPGPSRPDEPAEEAPEGPSDVDESDDHDDWTNRSSSG